MILSDQALTRQGRDSRALRQIYLLFRFSLYAFILTYQVNVLAQDEQDIDVVRVRTDLVTVPAYVTDKKDLRVTGLAATDFELRDNGRIVKLDYFAIGTERVALVFALDVSGSTRDVIIQLRETALALFSQFGRRSEVAVIRFAEKAELVSPFTRVSADVLSAFDSPTLANRRTAIFDSVASAIGLFDERPPDISERRVIILISDGLDTVSTTRPDWLITGARSRGISVYSIQIPLYAPREGRLRPRASTKGFREIAEKSGGRFFLVGDTQSALTPRPSYDLSPIFQAIEDDLRGQYLLGYYPEEASQDGRFHRIDLSLTMKDSSKLRVHPLREGYNSKR